MRCQSGDERGEDGGVFEIPDAVSEHYVVVCWAGVGLGVSGGGCAMKGYSLPDGGGFDVCLGVF